MQERKQDTRQKIQWGGLIKKAGLHEEPPPVLLGLLIEAKENLESKSGEKFRGEYRLKGDIVFTCERSGASKDHP
ncbi:MAG: conjugal transfer protein TraD [Gammaproteobacteria bacterium]|nr:conjugal transfer protein TraD [Gammaproteobacteria bacterium]